MNTTTDQLLDAWYELQFGVRRSIRYHQRRRSFFETLDQSANLIAVVFGSATILGVLQENAKHWAIAAGILVTAVSAINLVVGSSRKAWAHADFGRRFTELECKLLADPSEDLLHEITERRLTIEAEEPPILRVLDMLCHNEELRSEGRPQLQARITWPQRLFAQFFDVGLDATQPTP